jgi:histidine triad (HIT) family protein
MTPDLLYEDEQILAFKDINPQAPYHVLIIPKVHIDTINELDDPDLAGQLILTGQKIAKDLNIAESGYRLVFNCNDEGGQEIQHIHLHLLGGRSMQWSPG